MKHLYKLFCLGICLTSLARAAETVSAVETNFQAPMSRHPWDTSSWNVEQGVMWEIGTLTSFPYRLIETQVSWKSAAMFGRVFNDGSRVIVRNRFALIGAVIQQGPESRYIALSASPSIEWWNAAGNWSVFAGSGGGFGLVDSKRVAGALGQDFTLNWLIRGGVEHVISPTQRVSIGIMYQHMSNGGMTDPNPGIDALGFMVGFTWMR